mgnify:FL=1
MNIFDYLQRQGARRFDELPFSVLDGLILARLSYLPFESLLAPQQEARLADVGARLLETPELTASVRQKKDLRLLAALLACARYRDLLLFGCVAYRESEMQFFALTAVFSQCFVSFRGTDNTLAGWKEDFNMSFTCPIPSQTLAVSYLEGVAAHVTGDILIGGHSKGGNLAVYAAACCGAQTQARIRSVWNFDGPGFDERVLLTDGYRAVCDRVHTFVPQSSVVGMLLEHEEDYTIVRSRQHGILQHDLYSWQVEGEGFVCLETVNHSSRFLDHTIKSWVAGMDYAKRQKVVDAVFDLLLQTDAATQTELTTHWFYGAWRALRSMKNLDEETRASVVEALRLLAGSAKASLLVVVKDW